MNKFVKLAPLEKITYTVLFICGDYYLCGVIISYSTVLNIAQDAYVRVVILGGIVFNFFIIINKSSNLH